MASFALLRAARTAAKDVGPSPHAPWTPLVRLRTRLLRPWLDGEIARGKEAANSARALREAQLTSSRERTRLARRLEQVLTDPSAQGTVGGAVRVDGDAVEVARPVLTEMVLSLRSSEAVAARGVVLGWRLLTNPRSPVYVPPGRPPDPDDLWHESLGVLSALRAVAAGEVASR
jgi:hypothetical protein